MNTTILQICPAPADMVAYYHTEEVNAEGQHIAVDHPVSCLALVECSNSRGDRWQEVRAMIACDQQDALDFAGEPSNFITVSHEIKRVEQ